MKNFEIRQDGAHVLLGTGFTAKVGELVKQYQGKKVLFLYGQQSIKKNGLYEKVISALNKEKIEFVELFGVKPNPVIEKVNEAIELCKKENVDFILAVGGGSVIDSAKAIAGGVAEGGDVWDYYLYKRSAQKALPIGVILTIPATGSESNSYTVLTNGSDKRGSGAKVFIPKFAILDPENVYSLPKNQTAYGLVDMFLHTTETYFVNDEFINLQEKFAEGLLKAVIEIGPKLVNDLTNEKLRKQSFWCGNVALSGFLSKGTSGGDWVCHAIEHEFSAINDMAHGAGLAIVFPAWLTVVGKHNPKKVLRYSKEIFNVDTIEEGVAKTREFFESLGVETYLTDNSIKKEQFDHIINKLFAFSGVVGNYVKLTKEDIRDILNIAIK